MDISSSLFFLFSHCGYIFLHYLQFHAEIFFYIIQIAHIRKDLKMWQRKLKVEEIHSKGVNVERLFKGLL